MNCVRSASSWPCNNEPSPLKAVAARVVPFNY